MTEVRGDDARMTDKRRDSPRNDRPPTPEEDKYKVFIGGISRTTDENEIFEIFRKYNPKEVLIMKDLATQRPRGFGFVALGSKQDMEWAIQEMHNTSINGRVVTVSRARPRMEYREERGRDYGKRHYQQYQEGEYQRPYSDRPRYDGRRYQRDGRQDDVYHPPYYDQRRGGGRGNYGGDYDGRRNNYRSGGRDDYYHRDPPRQTYMDYDRRQQMRDRDEGRRWNPNDRRHYDRNPASRYRSPNQRDHSNDQDGGRGHYGPDRRRSEVRRVEPYRHRSRSPDRRGR